MDAAAVGGSGVLRLPDREIPVRPGHCISCPPEVRRQPVAGDEGPAWIGIGSAPPPDPTS